MSRPFVFLCFSLFVLALFAPVAADKSDFFREVTGIDDEGNVDIVHIKAPKIVLSSKEIYHYSILKVTLDGVEDYDPDLFSMKILRNGTVCPSFGILYTIPFRKKKDAYQAVYLPGWNETEGELEIQIFYAGRKINTDAPVKCLLKRRPVEPVTGVRSIVDLEMNKSVLEKSFYDKNGEKADYTAVLDWARFMRADALWILAGETTSFKTGKKIDDVWDEGPLENLYLLKGSVRDASIDIGAYVMSFYVPGRSGIPGSYEAGLGYNGDGDYLYRSRHISIGCEKRIDDIIELVRSFENDPDIQYIGFDFIRTGRADGYELAQEVINDTNIPTPLEWNVYTDAEKIRWFARKIEVEKDPIVIEKWRWWRAHRVALIIKRIIDEAGITKPVWVYTLGWEHGKEHGQDPVMFFDAGVSIDAVMLYEANQDQFARLLGQWQKYFKAGQGNIVIGNIVDSVLLDSDLSPPDELYRRNREGYRGIMQNGIAAGIFFHDISRGFWGRKGGYTFREYAMAFMSSVYDLKRDSQEPDLLIDVRIDSAESSKGSLNGELCIRNNSTWDITDIHIRFVYPEDERAGRGPLVAYTGVDSAHHTLRIDTVQTFELLKVPFILYNIDSDTESIRFQITAGKNLYYITKLL